MGEVWRARDVRLDRDVAVKILPEAVANDPKALSRFEAEARAVAALSHPNILALHDVGQEGGIRFAVTELLEGETLRERLDRGPLPASKVVEVGLQAARGLAAAHERRIVHRDVKPENLFLMRDGRLKILDFGLAKQHDLDPSSGSDPRTLPFRTEAGLIVGTAAYMSPEQVRSQDVDARSDIFALGTVLYEMLAGRRPFEAASAAETMAAIARDEPPDLASVAPGVPDGLARIVSHCLEKAPGARFQTAHDLVFALETLPFSAEVKTSVTRSTFPGKGRKARPRGGPRRPLVAWIAALVALAVGAFVGWWARGGRGTLAGPVPVSFEQLTDFPGVERQPAISPDGKDVVYVSATSGNEDIYLLRVGGRKPVNLTEDSLSDDDAPAFSPDGGHIAFRSERAGGGIFVMEPTGESVRRVTDFGFDPAWSPDGSRLALSTEGVKDPMSRAATSELWVVPLSGGSPRRLLPGDVVGPKWSPHGHRIAYWGSRVPSRNRDVWTVDAEGRHPPVAVTDDVDVDWSPEWSPDGRFLYFGSNRGGTLNLWRVPIDEVSGRVRGRLEPVTTPTTWSGWFGFARDGRTLVFSDLDERANVWRARFDVSSEKLTGSPEPVLRGRAINSIDFSPDGEFLTFSRRALPWEVLGVVKASGGGYASLTDGAFYHRVPHWSPDGSSIVFYSNRGGRVGFYTIRPDGSGLVRLGAVADEHLYPLFSPDAKSLAAATFGGGLAFLSLGGPQETVTVFSQVLAGVVFLPMSWSGDGARIAGVLRGQGSTVPGVSGGPRQGIFVFTLPDGPFQEVDKSGVSPEWLPDGRRLLLSRDGGIVLVDTATARRVDVLPRAGLPGSWGREIALTRDGRWLAWIESLGEGDVWLMTLSDSLPDARN
jgi:serine/threonine protein kinase